MRIAYVCADRGVPVFGHKGCSIHLREVVRTLAVTGARVELFATRFDGAVPHDWPDVRIRRLPFIFEQDPATRERYALEANAALAAVLRESGSFDLIYERYSLWSFAAMEHAIAASVPGILEVNAPLIEEQAQHRALVDRAAAEEVARRVFSAATALLAVSPGVASYLSTFPGARDRIHVVPNGVNPDRFASVALAAPEQDGRFTVGFVGSMKPWHGLPSLVEAFHRLRRSRPHAHLLIVGEGKERERTQQGLSSQGHGDDAVTFTGAVDFDRIPALLAEMDVAVAPYPDLPDFYFSPLKVYEYMAAGRAVVASDIGMLPQLIEDGVSGLLYPPGDSM